MKTKIIYISGSDIFDMADVRMAFEEVRSAVGLDADTVLFGVPVDSDDAGIVAAQDVKKEAPRKKIKKTAIQSSEPSDDAKEPVEKVIPILSVLSGKTDPIEAETNMTTETVAISDIVADAAPEAEEEKTLEKLFEEIAPLREDHDEFTPVMETAEPGKSEDGTDATLEKLATEFASTHDKIAPAPKSESTGKIGKLKNILPFKKAKREESGLMGDLFGWAGIAANDDEFTIPGFFTTVK